jgi:hypothetical protein
MAAWIPRLRVLKQTIVAVLQRPYPACRDEASGIEGRPMVDTTIGHIRRPGAPISLTSRS